MKKKIVLIGLMVIAIPLAVYARNWNEIASNTYGAQKVGCIKTSVTTSGDNRSVQLNQNKYYLLYGFDDSDNAGIAIRFIQGEVTIDVTNLAGSLEGELIFANQQRVIYTTGATRYVSVVSTDASKSYHLCELD